MATTYTSAVQQLYVAYFNRPADPAGLTFWSNAIASANGSTAAVAAAFSTSVEYTEAYEGMTNAQIVNQVYQNLFGRGTGSDAGADFWIKGLENKTITIADVVTAVAAGAQGTDLTAFNNKVTASTAFTAALDTDAEIAGYVGTDANEVAREWLAGVTTNASLATAILPTNLNTVVAAAVAAGTEFDSVSALHNLDSAIEARSDYLVSITDEDATATATATTVTADLGTAKTAFGEIFGDLNSAAYATYTASNSATVKAALIADQVAANAEELSDAQKDVTTANAAVAKVAGLQSAITKWVAAQDAVDNSEVALATAQADVAAKEASFAVTAKTQLGTNTIEVHTDGTVDLVDAGGAVVQALVISTDGVLSLYKAPDATTTTVTEKAYPGITALMNSLSTQEAAEITLTNAGTVATSTEAAVTALDPAHTLVDAQTAATDRVDAANEAIEDFNQAVADLNTAQQHSDDLAGYDATITALQGQFEDNGFNLVNIDDDFVSGTVVTEVATADSDIFVVGTHAATISLFGLQGTDSIYVGQGYTLNTGALSTGDNAKLEVFATQSGANTVLQVEQHAFSSSVTGAATNTAEIVKITLVGVTATDVHLDANGLITVA